MYGLSRDLRGSQGLSTRRWNRVPGLVTIGCLLSLNLLGFSGPIGRAAGQEVAEEKVDEPQLMRFEASTMAMGTRFSVIGYAADETGARQATLAAFDRVREMDEILSDYVATSEASQLGDRAGDGEWIEVSPTMADALKQSLEWHRVTQGAFDVSIGPLSQLWRRARREKKLPEAQALAKACEAVGSESIKLQTGPDRVRLERPGMRLDFGGIGQGLAADEMLRIFEQHGIRRVLIDASGDVRCGDPPPDRSDWEVAVAPLEPDGKKPFTIHLHNASVSTSGDAFQFLELEGKRFSHLIDPKTGNPVEGRSSVTVLASNATSADALASAMSVMGPERALALAECLEGVEVLIVVGQEQGVVVHRSSGWERQAQPDRTP